MMVSGALGHVEEFDSKRDDWQHAVYGFFFMNGIESGKMKKLSSFWSSVSHIQDLVQPHVSRQARIQVICRATGGSD